MACFLHRIKGNNHSGISCTTNSRFERRGRALVQTKAVSFRDPGLSSCVVGVNSSTRQVWMDQTLYGGGSRGWSAYSGIFIDRENGMERIKR